MSSLNQKLHAPHTIPFVSRKPEGQQHLSGQGLDVVEPDAVDRLTLVFELEGQVFFTHQPLRQHLDHLAEHRCCKPLAPDFFFKRVNEVDAAVFGLERAVGVDTARQGGGVQPFTRDLGEAALKLCIAGIRHGAAGRHGVAAKTKQHARVALGHQVQRVAQMKPGNRAARALELV